ncbi:MAG: ribonuclease H-like domain-containing protein [Candidatus Caldatribacterium sp.]|uniref:ribonuclease H-like domain-containing protein n=1 Tax=Candidatus Caldatribacterium sp. TaxID=2282143 RepID=UPI00299AFADA|nr:ribonuclease H-like domain-containing protein [Candidatus Caldatribacterium sp.]MCX7730742.1 ribonuclease H-like domain-containing protein [Candidatus Caldatribacterium sp.]MDW8081568.1 ribonuclease H-like domain-containing protein [Candidatus Calescibacterium sp.]
MLFATFCHIPKVGEKTERRIWESGIWNWEDALISPFFERSFPKAFVSQVRSFLEKSQRRLEREDAHFFAEHLPGREVWRLFPEFRHTAVFLDIETTGCNPFDDYVTAITLFDGHRIKTFVHGVNLREFLPEVMRYRVIITFNGKCFDLPFLERSLGVRLPHVHLDLCYILRSLGLSGGLKACEKALGMHRGKLEGVDGYTAVLLWRKYQDGCPEALETLLAYNVTDTVNLERLMVFAYNEKVRRLSAPCAPLPEPRKKILVPYQVHEEILDEVFHERLRFLSRKGEVF